MTNETNTLPTDFFSSKSLFTLSGAAGGVWLFCLVLSYVVPPNSLSVYSWRLVALSCSELFAITIIFQNKSHSFSKWLVGLFNGLLIFINASGINAVSTGLAFSQSNNTSKAKYSYNIQIIPTYATIFPFGREVNWWPDVNLLKKKNILEENAIDLNHSKDNLKKSLDSLKKVCSLNLPTKPKLQISNFDNSQNEVLLSQIKNLKNEIAILKKSTIVVKEIKSTPNNQNDQSSVLQNELTQCQEENLQMTIKLSKIRQLEEKLREADKFGL